MKLLIKWIVSVFRTEGCMPLMVASTVKEQAIKKCHKLAFDRAVIKVFEKIFNCHYV